MIGTIARVSFIQYMLKKPKKFGIKLWTLCGASSGNCLKFQIYKSEEKDALEKGLGGESCRRSYAWLPSVAAPSLSSYLQHLTTTFQFISRKAGTCGTIRCSHGQFLPSFTKAKLKRREMVLLQSKNLLAVYCCDKCDVFVISNIHSTGSVEMQHPSDKDLI